MHERAPLSGEPLKKQVEQDIADFAADLKIAKSVEAKHTAKERGAIMKDVAPRADLFAVKPTEAPESVRETQDYENYQHLSPREQTRVMGIYSRLAVMARERAQALHELGKELEKNNGTGPGLLPRDERALFAAAMQEFLKEKAGEKKEESLQGYYDEKQQYREPGPNERFSARG